MMLNRKSPPSYIEPEHISLPELETLKLKNGLQLHLINVPGTDAVRIEFLFDAGSWYQQKRLCASLTCSMLNEGTKKRSDKEIAALLDYYGAFIDLGLDPDHSWIVLYSLVRHLPDTLGIIRDILENSIFPERNFLTLLDKRKQNFLLENQKVKNLAKKKFAQVSFGSLHPYGASAEEADFKLISRKDLTDFFLNNYHPDRCRVYVSGTIENNFVNLFSEYFGSTNWAKNRPLPMEPFQISPDSERKHLVSKPDAIQSAIRLGCPAVTRDHADFSSLQVLNTILGGYFGSRLMKNLREEKGFTYGVGSALVPFRHAGVLVIACETGTEYTISALKEIYLELERLRSEPVPGEELQLVRNFLIGDLMRSADGPFQVAEVWKSILEFGLGDDYYQRIIREIRETSAGQLLKLTTKYLNPELISEVIAGNHP